MPITPQELNALASRASTLAVKFGYSSCSVRSYDPPVLEFHCADDVQANLVLAKFQLQGVQNIGIDPNNPSVVLRRV